MTKLDNFERSLTILQSADRAKSLKDDIYRMGVIGQFNLTFELAWKALKETLLLYGVSVAKTGSPREVLKEGYAAGFISDGDKWIEMMMRRNTSIHVYDYDKAAELIEQIFSVYTLELTKLLCVLRQKISALPSTVL